MNARKSIFAIGLLLAVLAVPAALPGGNIAVGTVEAASTDVSCDSDELYWTEKLGEFGPHYMAYGMLLDGVDQSKTKWDCKTQQDNLQYYQMASGQLENMQHANTNLDNTLQDSKMLAFSELEKNVIYSYTNSTSLSDAKFNAKQNVSRWYSRHEYNLVEMWSANAESIAEYENRSDYDMFSGGASLTKPDPMEYRIRYDDGTWGDWTSGPYVYLKSWDSDLVGSTTETVSYVNGTSRQVTALKFNLTVTVALDNSNNDQDTESKIVTVNPYDGRTTVEFKDYVLRSGNGYEYHYRHVNVTVSDATLNSPPNYSESDYPSQTYLWFQGWKDRADTLQNERDAFNNQADTYTEAVWFGLENGDIQPHDALSRLTKIDDYAPDIRSGNATFKEYILALSGMGLDGVDTANVSYMDVSMNVSKYDTKDVRKDGMLLSRWEPAGGWEYGKTYNAANLNGVQMFVTAEDNPEEFTIVGNFTIHGAWDSNNNSLNASDIDHPERDRTEITNSTEYIEMVNLWSEHIAAIEEAMTDDSGTGPTGSTSSSSNLLDWVLSQLGMSLKEIAMIISAFLAAVVLISVVIGNITPG